MQIEFNIQVLSVTNVKDFINIVKQFSIYEAEAIFIGGAIGTFIASLETLSKHMENIRGITSGSVSSAIGILGLIELN
jgi:methylthioribose-1-phosphate isomerase